MEDWVMQGRPALILIHMQHAITDPDGRVAFLHAKATWDSGIVPKQHASVDANQALHDIAMNTVIPAMALVTTTDDVMAHL